MTDLFTQQRNNRRATAWLLASFVILIITIGIGVDFFYLGLNSGIPVATCFALVFSTANGLFSFYKGDSLILASLRAVPLDFNDPEHKKLRNVVTEMAIASGLPMPKIYVIMDPAPNAFATGRDPEHALIGVTQGLLTSMSREELQGVVAHEMGHIKNYDIRLMMVVTVLLGTIVLISDWARRTMRYGGVLGPRNKRGRDKGGNVAVLVLFLILIILAPIVSRLMALAVSRYREYLADSTAAELTRNPLGLASALEKISQATSPLKNAHRGTAHLFISDPIHRKIDNKEGFVADALSTHPPIEKRIERLKRMAYHPGLIKG